MQQPHHLRDLIRGGGRGRGVVAHHDPAHGRVAGEEAGVDGQVAVEPVEPLAEGAPVPRRARLERVERHALDPRHHAHHVVDVLGPERRDREPAVAADHRGDAVQRRRGDRRVPQRLDVVVRVQVDEAGTHDQAVGVDGARRGFVDRTDRDDAPVADADVGRDAPVRRCRRPAGRRVTRRSSMPPPQPCSSAATAASTAVPAKNCGLPRV